MIGLLFISYLAGALTVVAGLWLLIFAHPGGRHFGLDNAPDPTDEAGA